MSMDKFKVVFKNNILFTKQYQIAYQCKALHFVTWFV